MSTQELLAQARPRHAQSTGRWFWYRDGNWRTEREVCERAADGWLPPDVFDRMVYTTSYSYSYHSEQAALDALRLTLA